jgi:hypothetical protein
MYKSIAWFLSGVIIAIVVGLGLAFAGVIQVRLPQRPPPKGGPDEQASKDPPKPTEDYSAFLRPAVELISKCTFPDKGISYSEATSGGSTGERLGGKILYYHYWAKVRATRDKEAGAPILGPEQQLLQELRTLAEQKRVQIEKLRLFQGSILGGHPHGGFEFQYLVGNAHGRIQLRIDLQAEYTDTKTMKTLQVYWIERTLEEWVN